MSTITFGRYKGEQITTKLIDHDREYFETVYIPYVKRKGWYCSADRIIDNYLADTAKPIYPKIDYTRRPLPSRHVEPWKQVI